MTEPPQDPNDTPQWRSYLMPGTDVLRTIAELTDPTATAIFERIVSADAETALRQDTDRPKTFDLAHHNNIHERLFADVYPFAGALRYVDTAKPGQSGEPFLHHRWIDTYTAAVTQQLRLEESLTTRTDPGQWADRAAYYWASMLHAHPYREGNGRAVRLWIEDLAHEAGHELDWTRSSPERATCMSRWRPPMAITSRCAPCSLTPPAAPSGWTRGGCRTRRPGQPAARPSVGANRSGVRH